jgi:beta-glucuronidase
MKTHFLLLFTFLASALSAMAMTEADPKNIALTPQQNEYRNVMMLDGIWQFCADPDKQGESAGWQNGLPQSTDIAVPGSWNDQVEGMHNYLGLAWYETDVYVPAAWRNERIFLRFNSANYMAQVWVNGIAVGQHEGGHLPFAFEVNSYLKIGQKNHIAVTVENELSPTRVPNGNVPGQMRSYPATNYDFFPYSGLQRSVMLYTLPRTSLQDVTITTGFEGSEGTIKVAVEKQGNASRGTVIVTDREGRQLKANLTFTGNQANVEIKIPDVHLWSCDDPYLYDVDILLGKTDAYHTHTGVRTIAKNDQSLLLNGKPIRLRGFGMHEDFPVFGRGVAHPVTVRDFQLLKWIGANSFRTSHYPYDETVYDIADREGILIIDEIPAVGLLFYDGAENVSIRQKQCEKALSEMLHRDKNHPSVIVWSVANEPMHKGVGGANYDGKEKQGEDEENQLAIRNLGRLVEICHEQDPSRLATFVAMSGSPSSWHQVGDIICINRYYGWYTNPGHMDQAMQIMNGELEKLYGQYHTPIVMTEFGADTSPGFHSHDHDMFSEEFQCEFIASYLDLANTKDYVTGMMVWNFADFKTGSAMHRMNAMNYKGVFTQTRQPKMAAHELRQRWVGTNRY